MADDKQRTEGAQGEGGEERPAADTIKADPKAAEAALQAFLNSQGAEEAAPGKPKETTAADLLNWDDWGFFNEGFNKDVEEAFPDWDTFDEGGPATQKVKKKVEAAAERAEKAEERAEKAEEKAEKAEEEAEAGDAGGGEKPAMATGGEAAAEQRAEKAAAAARTPVVVFDQVTKTYAPGTRREFTAIKDVTFTVEDLPDKGEFIAVLGPSGCGKSTVLRLIAGLEPQHPPTKGAVKVFGQQVRGPGSERGMVFQSYTSFDHRTVLGNVAFGLECRGVAKREREELAREWIDKVGLSVNRDAQKYPHQLSGGMQQRVAIARTLILKPKIILMDEPFGALDPVTRMKMQDLLVELWQEVEATVFFITHSIDEAVYLGDRVYLFSRSPGTILRQMPVPPPDKPAMEMQRDPQFQDVVFELRETINRLEREADAEEER